MKRLEEENEKFFESVLAQSLENDSGDRMAFFSVPENDREDETCYGNSPYVFDTQDLSNPFCVKEKARVSEEIVASEVSIPVPKKQEEILKLPEQQEIERSSTQKTSIQNHKKKFLRDGFFGERKYFTDGVRVSRKTIAPRHQKTEPKRDVFYEDFLPETFQESEKPFSEEVSPIYAKEENTNVFPAEVPENAFENTAQPFSVQEKIDDFEQTAPIPVDGYAKSFYECPGPHFQGDIFEDLQKGTVEPVKKEETGYAKKFLQKKKREFRWKSIFERLKFFVRIGDFFPVYRWRFALKPIGAFAGIGFFLLLGVGGVSYVVHGFSLKGSVLGVSALGMQTVSEAIEDLKRHEFIASHEKFELAARTFSGASEEISAWAGILSNIGDSFPFLSKLSSGKSALEAGEHLALAGKNMASLAEVVSQTEFRGSLLEVFRKGLTISEHVKTELNLAQQALSRVRVSDLPTDKQDSFLALKSALPDMLAGLDVLHSNAPAFLDVLGGNGPRKYLFLFQNNQESRATGGFIGSYGLLDIKEGEIRKFFINGIFDPDGQLKESVIPPQPIRKISAAWSLHDSNWFADFPTSAEKAIFFYEKTGGPTVDGVITMTPTVLQRILRETGPVFLEQYNETVDADNVISLLQYKVEKDYDKEENKPKKILSDLAPIVFDRILHAKDASTSLGVIQALHTSLREKDILLYSRNEALEKMYREMGWSGELRETQKDFVSVVNSNINGFKTDGVIEQTVRHHADIRSDGSVVDTVTITRKHTGGDTPYEWWNAVNADYMRVYVPKGATLLSARGQTRETVQDPLDYAALGFSRDALVSETEARMRIDADSGTQIFEESGKTVFGNWVYVSPKESVTVEYTYQLPFSVFVDEKAETATYSLLAQKQSGSIPGTFVFDAEYPKEWKTSWRSFEENPDRKFVYDGPFSTDLFFGYVFE